MRKLPPLNGVKAFEATARLMSFTKAGLELNVTHGAVSKQVSLLEAWLGFPLFRRTKSKLALTLAGKSFLDSIGPALDRIALATMQLRDQAEPVMLAVNAPPTFTLRWLIPRLSSFQRRHLGIDVRLTTAITPVDFSAAAYHIAIRGSVQPLPDVDARPFLTESIVAVCHPDLLEQAPLATAADLVQHTLLSYSTEPYSWQDWFAAVNASHIKPAATLAFEQMYFTLQAAMEGLGVALIPYFLVADDVAAGRLCTPLKTLGVRNRIYYANRSRTAAPNANHDAFCAWLIEEGVETMKLCDQLLAKSESRQGGTDIHLGQPQDR